MMRRTAILTGAVYLFLAHALFAQTKVDATGLAQLQNGLQSLAKDDCLVHANWGFCLMDPATGKIIASHEPEKSLTPASGMKAITTMVALNTLGTEYRYATYLEIDGTLGADSVLHGNLYIRGTGDPTLGSGRYDSVPKWPKLMEQWLAEIKKKGINHITGNIIADAGAFEDYAVPGSWNWDDIGQYYGAGPYGLNINENAYTIYYSSSTVSATIDSIVPEIEGLTVHSDVTVSGSSDNAFIYGAPDNYYRYVVGTIPAKRKAYSVNGSMPDPPLFPRVGIKESIDQCSCAGR
ncbi:MAG: D-alanyl-D-alanine carboxypeptidase [Chitinophagales bacterium]